MSSKKEMLEIAIQELDKELSELPESQRNRVKIMVEDLANMVYSQGRDDERYHSGNWIVSPSSKR